VRTELVAYINTERTLFTYVPTIFPHSSCQEWNFFFWGTKSKFSRVRVFSAAGPVVSVGFVDFEATFASEYKEQLSRCLGTRRARIE
jgi:hypothetical protein